MWLLLAMVGAVAASAVVETGLGGGDEDEESGGSDSGAATESGDEPEDERVEGELIEHAEPDDAPETGGPWLEGEDEVEYPSSDEPAPRTEPDRMPFEFIRLNEPGAERDPWLEGWKDDEYVSTDEPPADPAGAAAAIPRPVA